MQSININADLGEENNIETEIMPLISAANIACGGHAGNPDLIASCIRLAQQHDVKIGIHPSYPDREHFGRKSMEMTSLDIWDMLAAQISTFISIAQREKAEIHHLKLHGALYHDVANDEGLARILLSVIKNYSTDWIIFGPPNSALSSVCADVNQHFWTEAFLDRNYLPDGQLVPRSQDNSIISDPASVWLHLKNMWENKKIKTTDGTEISIQADTFCIHGDHPNSVAILKYIHQQFANESL